MNTYDTLSEFLQGDTPYNFGRSLYKFTDCGPWVIYQLKDGSEVYYEDNLNFNPEECIAIKIGSIVEGSEVEIEPICLSFPFTEEDFHHVIKSINEEASYYWKRDNTDTYIIKNKDEIIGHVEWTQFEEKPVWEGEIPQEVKDSWIKWHTYERWENGWISPVEENKDINFGLEDWNCMLYINDEVF